MCFNVKPPEQRPLPPTPTVDDDSVRRREMLERERLAAQSGTASTIKTDLTASDVSGGGKRVLLGV